jgi:hypothetical protein
MLVVAILLAALAAAVTLAARARRRGAGWRTAIAAAVVLFVGLVAAALGVAHEVAVIAVAAERAAFTWDFRFASLLLVGLLLAAAGLTCAAGAFELSRGTGAYGRALVGAVLLLLVNAPLIPVQGFAVALSVAAVVALVSARIA